MDESTQNEKLLQDFQTEQDNSKENVNVVIVPESILQAIKNSSSHFDIRDGGIQLNSDLQTSRNDENKDLWVSESINDNNHVNQNIYFTQSNIKDNSLNNHDTFIDLNCKSTQNLNVFNTYSAPNNTNQNSLAFPVANPDLVTVNPTNMSNIQPINQFNVNMPFIAMRVQSVEMDGDKNIYTLAPATLENNNTASNPIPIKPALPKPCDERNQKGTTLLKLVNSTIRKPSVMADKGTLTRYDYVCDVNDCNKSFNSATKLRKHKVTVHEKEKFYKCKYANCLWSFSTSYKLRRHLETHYKRKTFSCTFPGCEKVFSTLYNQKAHMEVHTTVKTELICKLCNKYTANKRDLAVHQRTVHNEKPTLQCTFCKQMFYTSSALIIHKRTHNPQRLSSFDCPFCEKKFGKRSMLKEHLYMHTGERPFPCEHCDWSFTSVSRLNRHMKIHEEKKFCCNYEGCSSKFHRSEHLNKHLQYHISQERKYEEANKMGKGRQYICAIDGCSFKGLTRGVVLRHQIKNHQEQLQKSKKKSKRTTTNNVDELKIGEPYFDENGFRTLASSNQIEPIQEIVIETSIIDNEIELVSPTEAMTFNSTLENSEQEIEVPLTVIEPRTSVLDTDWSSSLLSSTPITPSQYLTCSSEASSLVPFMDDIASLSQANTQHLIDINDNLSCVPQTSDIEPTDVLQRYVVGPNLNVINSPHLSDIMNKENFTDEKLMSDEIPVAVLFEDGILNKESSVNNFEGSTINLNDLH